LILNVRNQEILRNILVRWSPRDRARPLCGRSAIAPSVPRRSPSRGHWSSPIEVIGLAGAGERVMTLFGRSNVFDDGIDYPYTGFETRLKG
jgi:hypothetical protein